MPSCTVASVLNDAKARLNSETPRLDAELLLAHTLNWPQVKLYTFPEKELSPDQLTQFNALLARRIRGEPVAYLIGERGFWSLDLSVNANTLIPRPDTEVLVETALEIMGDKSNISVLDLGTGSGAIALSLAKEKRDWIVTAIDFSEGALKVAAENAVKNNLNVRFLLGSWFEPVAVESFELIVSNPPYIPADDEHLTQGDVRFEPITALASGQDGLDDIRHIVATAPKHLRAGGWLMFEHGYDQAVACQQLLAQIGFTHIESRKDLGGNDRITLGQWLG